MRREKKRKVPVRERGEGAGHFDPIQKMKYLFTRLAKPMRVRSGALVSHRGSLA